MARSVYTTEYRLFLQQLKAARGAAGLTIRETAERLSRSHSYVSKCENGSNRVDVAQLYEFCRVYGVSFGAFATDLERLVEESHLQGSKSSG